MKNNSGKGIILALIIGLLLVVGLVISSVFKDDDTSSKEYKEQLEIYNRYVKASKKVNSVVNSCIKDIDDVLGMILDADDDTIMSLKSKKKELGNFVIEISDKKIKKTSKLKEKNEKLEKQLKEIDKNLIILKEDEIESYEFSEDSKIKVLTNEVGTLIKSMETLIQKQKILNGDVSVFNGTYRAPNYTDTVVIKDDKFIVDYGNERVFETRKMKEIKYNNGVYVFTIKSEYSSDMGIEIGTFIEMKEDGKTVVFCEDLGCLDYTKD